LLEGFASASSIGPKRSAGSIVKVFFDRRYLSRMRHEELAEAVLLLPALQ
jgi:hypothetical protein